ncbi:exostosin domain-containing protein [Hyphococcus lacteus]|uniref:Exostosin family protein n=1 Tax=Hyphococcus lacteus TaxID=3143536 RepID=A0ABV3Z132_9PROT
MQEKNATNVFVVTPSFNAGTTIIRTLMSVASQSGNIRIFHHVADGGSNDSTVSKLRDWSKLVQTQTFPVLARKYQFSFSSEPDNGMYDAIANGFSQFSLTPDDWMCWINADDVFLPGSFALLGQVSRAADSKEISWLTGTAAIAAEDISMLHTSRPVGSSVVKHDLCDGTHWEFIQSEGTFFKNKLWHQIDIQNDFRRFRYAGDWNLWRLFAQNHELFQTKHPLAVFSIRDGQLSSTNRSEYEAEIEAQVSTAERESNFDALGKNDLVGKAIRVSMKPIRIIVEDRNLKNHLEYRHLERKKSNALVASQQACGSIIAHDEKWQFPAITEQHAFNKVKEWMPPNATALYFAFPWATLIDKTNNKADDAGVLEKEALNAAKNIFPSGRPVITVCQHILMEDFLDIFRECGITDIFWTHATKMNETEDIRNGIRIHPFPLFPVQVGDNAQSIQPRDILFSFIGAKSNQWYLTDTRRHIIELLEDDPRGVVIGREDWHYNKIVYSHQVKATHVDPTGLVDMDRSKVFKETLNRSIFSLCPSGSGPNSIRLWESIASGSIPVIMADTYLPPGDETLWQEAAVFVEETQQNITELPELLEELAKDTDLISTKRKAMQQLLMLYGPDAFIYDIQNLILQKDQDAIAKSHISELPLSGDQLLESAQLAFDKKDAASRSVFLNALASRALIAPEEFSAHINDNKNLQPYIDRAVKDNPEDENVKIINRTRNASLTTLSSKYIKEKVQVSLQGKHSNRTPLSYPAYRELFTPYIDYTASTTSKSICVTGFDIDFRDSNIVSQCLDKFEKKPVVISEEPLWDTVWATAFDKDTVKMGINGQDFAYKALNHMTSPIFAFDKLPYFITTENHYFVRYANLFKRNAELTPAEILAVWDKAKWKFASFAERREDSRYDFTRPNEDLYGLSAYRTRIADGFGGNDALRCGKGWNETGPRQALPDWHLDKLASLDRNSFVVSGLENTHQQHYITEKIFDAFACLGVPLYFASPKHRIHDIIPSDTFINLFGLESDEAIEKIKSFAPDLAFAEAYLETQKRLSKLFSDPQTLIKERNRVVDETVSALIKL